MNSQQFTHQTLQRKKGYTIVELLIYMGILSILLLLLTNTFASIVGVRLESESTSAVEQDGSFILARLFYDVARAQSVTTPANLGDTSSTLQIVIGGVNYIYTIDTGNLELNNNSGPDVLNGINTTVSNPSFQRIGNVGGKSTIRLSFTVSSKTSLATGPKTKTFQTTVGLR